MLVLTNWGVASYLDQSAVFVEGLYQVLGFFTVALLIWLGVRCGWTDVVNTAVIFFVIFLCNKLFDWWWEVLPKSLFFLVLGFCALLVLRHLHGPLGLVTEGRS